MKDRYDISDLPEAQFEPGSKGDVLRNLLGIKVKKEMDVQEARLQVHAMEECFTRFDENHCFTAADISDIHKIWLGGLYSWAGRYRQVNISKGNFSFAMAAQIPKLMDELEKIILRRYTPCIFKTSEEIAEALAVVHTELVLIHPFRDGNGRAARMLSVIMGSQAGLPPLDFSVIKGRQREAYFAAVRAGLKRNYKPMEMIFKAVLIGTKQHAEED